MSGGGWRPWCVWCAHICNLQVVGALARVMRHTVRERVEWQTPVVARLMQGTLHALTQLVAHMAPVAQALSCRSLKRLIFNLLSSLLHPRVASQGVGESGEAAQGSAKADEAAKQMLASMNALLMHALKRAQANRVLSVLIRFLYQRPADRWQEGEDQGHDEGDDDGEMDQALSPELVEAVLKCLLEMARRMRTYLAHLDIDLLLFDIHQFLTLHPPSRFRGQEFKPLRLLKTIINELVKLRGQEIRKHLTLIPVDTNPTLCSYLDLVFKQQRVESSFAPGSTLPRHTQAPAQDGLEAAEEGFQGRLSMQGDAFAGAFHVRGGGNAGERKREEAAEDACQGAPLHAADARTEASNEVLEVSEVLVSETVQGQAPAGAQAVGAEALRALLASRPAISTQVHATHVTGQPLPVSNHVTGDHATSDHAGEVQWAHGWRTNLSLNLPDMSAVPAAATAAAALKGPGATDKLINKYQALRCRAA